MGSVLSNWPNMLSHMEVLFRALLICVLPLCHHDTKNTMRRISFHSSFSTRKRRSHRVCDPHVNNTVSERMKSVVFPFFHPSNTFHSAQVSKKGNNKQTNETPAHRFSLGITNVT